LDLILRCDGSGEVGVGVLIRKGDSEIKRRIEVGGDGKKWGKVKGQKQELLNPKLASIREIEGLEMRLSSMWNLELFLLYWGIGSHSKL